MHILHILDHSLPLHSGYTFRSRNILHSQTKQGFKVTVLTSPKHQESWKGKYETIETVEGVPHYRTTLKKGKHFPVYYEARIVSALGKRLRKVVSLTSPDVIHAHSPILNIIPAFRTNRFSNIPIVYEIRAFWEDAAVDHGTYAEGSWKYRTVRHLETQACHKAAHVFVLCDGLRRDLMKRGIPSEKISIARNGINLEQFNECSKDQEITEKYDLNGKKVIGFSGSFYRYEGLDLLLDAFSLVVKNHRHSTLLLVGGGEMEEKLKEKVRNYGLQNYVHFPGRIQHDRMPGIYAAMDILAYPRYSMRLTELVTPLKPLEAMAMAKTVLASNVGGHKELIRDGETGILFSSGDVSALAAKLDLILTNTELRKKLSQNGYDHVRREYPWEKTTAVYGDIYREILGVSDSPEPEPHND